MHALVFNKELQYVTDYPKPNYGKDDALIRIIQAGICNTDIEITRGYMGFSGIPGHEFVGIVEKCADKILIGKRVVGEINIGCSNCVYCKNKLKNHCPDRTVLGILGRDGVFAEYTAIPAENLHVIPDSVTDDEAVFVEPLAAAFEILEQTDISSSDKVCVLGDGKLGLLVGQVLSVKGCNLVVVGKHGEKLSLLEELGIKTRLKSVFSGKDYDFVVDCTGSRNGIGTALGIVKPRGKIFIKTTVLKNRNIDLNKVVIDEISIIGSRCGPFEKALEAIKKKEIELYSLISSKYSMKDGLAAFQHAATNEVIKVILEVS